MDTVVEFSDVSVEIFVDCAIDVIPGRIEGILALAVADDVVDDSVDFPFEFTDMSMVAVVGLGAVVIVIGVDNVFVVVIGVCFVDVLDVDGFAEDVAVNGKEESSDITDDAVDGFIDGSEVVWKDNAEVILDGSMNVVIGDFNGVPGVDFVKILDVGSID